MYKKVIKYVDYDGNERTEEFLFNLTKAEVAEMEVSADGGLANKIDKIVKAKDGKEIIAIFKNVLLKAYGVKSSDGRRFIKSQELRDEFEQTEAYSQLFMELATNDSAAADFINAIVPSPN